MVDLSRGQAVPFDAFQAADEIIPAVSELKARDQWVGWRYVTRPGARKPTKPPVNPHNGHGGSHSNRSTWGSYKQAMMAVERYALDGPGYVLSDDDDYTGIDLDKCRNAETGEIEPWALEVLAFAETYAEISPSGTGIRMFARGKIDKAIKCDVARVEIYGANRYLTITGNHVEGTPLDIREAPKTIEALTARAEAMSAKREERPEPERPRAASSKPRAGVTAGERAWAAAKLDAQAKEVAQTGAGGRNNRLNEAAYTLGHCIAAGWIEESTVRARLEEASKANGYWRDKGPHATRATISSGISKGKLEPHAPLEDRESPEDDEAIRIGDAIAEARIARAKAGRERVFVDGVEIDPETGEVIGEAASASDEPAAGASDEPPHDEQAARRTPGARQGVNVEIVVASEFAGKPVSPQEWHVEGLIPAHNVTMLAGDGATGKSLLALQLAVATATNGTWIGFRPKSGKVLFVSAEDEIDELHRRLARICPRLETLDNLAIVPLAGKDAVLAAPEGSNGLLRETPLFKAIRHIIAKHGPDLLVLDTLADLFGGDQIKTVQARQFIAMLRGLALQYGVTVLLLSHPSQSGMNSGSGTGGSQAWNNSVRSRLYFERRITKDGLKSVEDDVNVRVLTTKKANRAANGGTIVVRYDKGQFVREQESTLNARDAAHQAERVFLELLAKFTTQGRNVSPTPSAPTYAPNVFAKDDEGKGITKRAFEQAMSRLFTAGRIVIAESGPPSRRRQIIVLAEPQDEPAMADEEDEMASDEEVDTYPDNLPENYP